MADKQIILFDWDGETMIPAKGFAKRCDEYFVVGERYRMGVEELRSWVTHAHQFAWIADAWANLPESMAGQFPTPEHLRKFALVKTGHCTMKQHPCKNNAEAQRLAATIRIYVEYSVVQTEGSVVTVFEPMSQSMRAMGKAQFQKSKTDILDYIAGLLEVAPGVLANQGQAA